MARIRSVTLLAMAGLLAMATAAHAQKIAWRSNVKDALAEAANGDRLVMIEFFDKDCEWCQRMDSETLTDADVVTTTSGVVPVRVDIAQSPDLAKQYQIEGVPAFVFVEANGNEAARIMGYVPAPLFIERVKNVLAEQEKVVGLRKRIAAEPANSEAKADLARIYVNRRQGDMAAPLVDALDALPKEKAPKDMAEILLGTAVAYGSRGNNDRALVYLEKVTREYPDTEEAEWAGLFTGLALGLKGDRDAAIKQLEKVVATTKIDAVRERARMLLARFREETPSPSL